MKKMSKKIKILTLLIALVIIAGMIVTFTIGFNFDLKYQETKKIQLYLENKFEIADIKQITNEVLENQDVVIQKVEVYEDSVNIIAKDITEEQKTEIVNKINEKYGIELVADNVQITNIPHMRAKDIIKPYIMPFAIATIIVLAYMAVRYYQLGMFLTMAKTLGILVITQAVLVSVIVITRIPLGGITLPLVLAVYVLSLLGLTSHTEKKLAEKKEEEK